MCCFGSSLTLLLLLLTDNNCQRNINNNKNTEHRKFLYSSNHCCRDHPNLTPVPFTQRTSFYVDDDYLRLNPSLTENELLQISAQPGFFRNLPVIAGSVEALRLLSERYNVFICTSPLWRYENCVLEKFQWLEQHFGFILTTKVVLTRDKTMVRGDVLVDDKPNIKGCMSPQWKQVVFSQLYNRQETSKFRIEGWKEVGKLIDYIDSL